MDRLSVTTHLIAVITAFSAFTMPIALEVLNRVKSRYGSAYYMDSIEKIMGFKIQLLFRELIVTLIALISFSLFVSSVDNTLFPDNYVLLSETVFSLIASILLIKEFKFIKTVFLATRSDSLVTEHLISKLSTTINNDINHSNEVELLIQIACFNIENTATTSDKSIEYQLFDLIEKSYTNQSNSISTQTIKKLLDGLAVALTSARNTNSRDKYVSLQRDYGKHLILFFDKKIKNHDVFERFSSDFYEESIKELNSNQYWLLRADFLIGIHTCDIQNPQTIVFIDKHVRNLIDFLVNEKPELLPELIEKYRNFISYESYFGNDIYRLSNLFGDYNLQHFKEVNSFTETHKELLGTAPQSYIDNFIALLDKYKQDKLNSSMSPVERQGIEKIATEYEKEMVGEIIKDVGSQAAKRTAQYTLRALSQKGLWRCILDCHESFSPASSRVIRLGINLLPASLSSIIQQLGKPYGYSSLKSDELSLAYVKAVPILVMYTIYNWRIKHLDQSLHCGIAAITNSLSMGDKTIQNANKILEELKQSMYYAKSPTYAEALCSHFDIRHEEVEFSNIVIPVLEEVQKYLENQVKELRKTQPLSEEIKQRYINNILMTDKDLPSILPFFSYVSLSKEKLEPQTYPMKPWGRETFLDKTGAHTFFGNYMILERVHSKLALQTIKNDGIPLSAINFDELGDNHLLVMTHKDWQSCTASIDGAAIRDIKRHLVSSSEPLEKFYIYDTEEHHPMVTLYSPENNEKVALLSEHMRNAFDFKFNDKDDQVAVEICAHIYF
ncbi:MAG: hypothetical protein ACI88H_002610 [Cocleimonas sp.]|jgi:hypothetical protein